MKNRSLELKRCCHVGTIEHLENWTLASRINRTIEQWQVSKMEQNSKDSFRDYKSGTPFSFYTKLGLCLATRGSLSKTLCSFITENMLQMKNTRTTIIIWINIKFGMEMLHKCGHINVGSKVFFHCLVQIRGQVYTND